MSSGRVSLNDTRRQVTHSDPAHHHPSLETETQVGGSEPGPGVFLKVPAEDG